MAFQDLLATAQQYFPSLQIKYKNKSLLMKFLGILLFFNKGFMTNYTTTIGSTIYLPNSNFVKLRPVSGAVVFMHELTHLYDQKRIGYFFFMFSYLWPQILVLPAFFLFLISWKIALPVILLLCAPLPAYFRMKYEKRAYLSSLYAIQKLGVKLDFKPHLETQSKYFIQYFSDNNYYYMWPFGNSVSKHFVQAIKQIQRGERPFQDPVFDMLDDLITKV